MCEASGVGSEPSRLLAWSRNRSESVLDVRHERKGEATSTRVDVFAEHPSERFVFHSRWRLKTFCACKVQTSR